MNAPAFDRRALAWRLARLAVVVLVVVLVIVTVPGLGSLRSRFARAQPDWIIAACALQVGSVLCFALAFQRTFADRVSAKSSVSLALTAQGVNVLVPAGGTGGLAVAGVLMSRAGMAPALAARRLIALFLITSVITNVLLLIIGGFGTWTGALPGRASWVGSLLPALLAVALAAAAICLAKRPEASEPSGRRPSRPGARSRTSRLVRRGAGHLRDGLTCTGELLWTCDPLLMLGGIGYIVLDLGVLAVAFRALGASTLPLGTLLLAYTLGQAGSVISLPGTTEGGLVGVFVLYGAPLALATSAILVYRAVQSLVPLALGSVGVAGLRHGPRLR
jgi:uncharacterized membrane protein YbhN (UPF0104 family)